MTYAKSEYLDYLKLVGHCCPLGRYPARVIPIFASHEDLVATFVDNGRVEVRQVTRDTSFVTHGAKTSQDLAQFDYSSDGLFAASQDDVRAYRISERAQFFSRLLADPTLSASAPFVRLSLAKETQSPETIRRELLVCARLLQRRSFGFANSWYALERDRILTRWGVSDVVGTLPDSLQELLNPPRIHREKETSKLDWPDMWERALQLAREYWPKPVYLHFEPATSEYWSTEPREVWLEFEGQRISPPAYARSQAFESLWRECLDLALSFCWRRYPNDADEVATDAVQRLLWPTMTPPRSIRVPFALPGVIYQYCHYAARDLYRRKLRRPPNVPIEEVADELFDDEPDPEARAIEVEHVSNILHAVEPVEPFPLSFAAESATHERLYRALGELDRRERELIYQIYFRELRRKDVAKLLDVSPATVTRLHSTALMKIRQLMQLSEDD